MKNTSLKVHYSFRSYLGEDIDKNYITPHFGKIFHVDLENEEDTQIGSIDLNFLLLGEALNNQLNYIDVFDRNEYTLRVGNKFMDFSENDLNLDIQEFYNYTFTNNDIAIIKKFELSEKFKGRGIEKKIIRDLYYRFASTCGLFIVETFPLQFQPKVIFTNKYRPDSNLEFDYQEPNLEKFFLKLKAFYQNIGFDHIDGYNDLMFLNPALVN
ncbi:MAG: hypothetical protein AB8H03_04740 [Saprospiraceae bacterium]